MKVNFTAPSEFEVFLEPPSITVAPVKYLLSQNDFVTPPIPTKGKKVAKIPPAPYLIIGFDTEFQTSAQNYTHQEMIAGKVKNTILSYQFHAIYSGNTSSCAKGASISVLYAYIWWGISPAPIFLLFLIFRIWDFFYQTSEIPLVQLTSICL